MHPFTTFYRTSKILCKRNNKNKIIKRNAHQKEDFLNAVCCVLKNKKSIIFISIIFCYVLLYLNPFCKNIIKFLSFILSFRYVVRSTRQRRKKKETQSVFAIGLFKEKKNYTEYIGTYLLHNYVGKSAFLCVRNV